MKVTIKHIAELAGVSIATVSKVINHKDEKITHQTRDRVLEVIKEQGYIPNRVASSMVTKRTKTLGLMIPDITNPFFPELARGVEDGANEMGYTLILCNSDNDLQKEESYLEMLQEKMVDGIIFTASSRRTTMSSAFLKLTIPVVSVDREIEGLKLEGKITVDNEKGAFEAVCYLLEKGYRKIYHISGPLLSKTAKDRYAGFIRAHKEKGIMPIEDHLLEGNYTSTWGYDYTKKLIEEQVDFDSLFCGNDLIALGAYKALHEKNIRIPEDIGIIGFDDIYMAEIVSPGLTTVRQPSYSMGYKAAEMMLDRIKNKDGIQKEWVLESKLIIRGSTK
ncbi:MAG: LacI family transcriptional regulator [Firmicutes bacterium HGW-Firmicutes-5]|nr:MAG: LacI family transcriptional regulator [Firmicutes bacterium HGW-Firmicutes-5]